MTSSKIDNHACYFQSAGHAGDWVPRSQVQLSVDDVGFRQGVTAVERLRTYDGNVFRAQRYLARWDQTVETLKISSVSSDVIAGLLDELVSRNQPLIERQGDVGITIFATPGEVGSGIPTLCLHLNPIDHALVENRRAHGQHVVVTDVQQPVNECWPRTAKVRSRIHYHLADHLARQQDPSACGLLVDADGSITETSIANIAIVESGSIVSPEHSQVLAGITQSVAMELASDLSIAWTRDRISPDRLRAADEVLLMGTDTGIWFASHVDDSSIGDGKRGPVCERLQTGFGEVVR